MNLYEAYYCVRAGIYGKIVTFNRKITLRIFNNIIVNLNVNS